MTADHIDRAAEIIYVEVFGLPDYSPDAVDDHNRHSYRGDCECNASDRVDARHAAEKLDAAGLFVTSGHDAEVTAKTMREVARELNDAVAHLYDGADRIEREAGESDADA